jgi:hypothetical protein
MDDPRTIKVLGFAGSLRKGSYNRMALRAHHFPLARQAPPLARRQWRHWLIIVSCGLMDIASAIPTTPQMA